MISYFLIKREGITPLDQNISSIHSVIKVKYLQIFRLIYDTPSSCTMNKCKAKYKHSQQKCMQVRNNNSNICLFIYISFNLLSRVPITRQFCITYYSPPFYHCCIKLDDYIDKINKLSLDIDINNYMKLSHWPWQFQI